GRGTTDMKGFLACVMATASYIDASSLKHPIHIAVTFDEEIGCIGAEELVEFMRVQQINPAAIFVGEPTNMRVVDRHKGSIGFTTTVGGKAAHSSQPQEGISAIHAAAELISFLTLLGKDLTDAEMDDNFSYPYPSINVGVVHGGHVRNIVAPECSIEWELRPILPDQLTKVRKAFDARVAETLTIAAQSGGPMPSIKTECVWTVPPLVADPQSLATSVALQILNQNQTQAVSYGTEAGIYQQAGHPTVVCGPGNIDQAHKPDEWIAIEELSTCLNFLRLLIDQSTNPAA
ncbi:M20 family metallopeptidase, partial [Paraburkholderia aspalathi]|nr:M20 family metallopeptidase [Paraburkholderia aspalathi]